MQLPKRCSIFELYIANKNYSSWSLRPWVLFRELEIPFVERSLAFGDRGVWDTFRGLSPNGTVPCLVDGNLVVWDSLAIVEYVAERHATVWSADRVARSWARCAAAEMHSGFSELRNRCSMSCGIKMRLHEYPERLERDVVRLNQLWNEGLRRFGGPFLAGSMFTAVDAFFAPVVFRANTYNLSLSGGAAAYAERMLTLASMREWYGAALAETIRDLPHEAEIGRMGEILEDLRAT